MPRASKCWTLTTSTSHVLTLSLNLKPNLNLTHFWTCLSGGSLSPSPSPSCYTLGPILLARVSNVLIFCHIWLVWTDYVYHRFAWRPYRTFPQSRYLAVLDPLTRLGSPSYSSSHSHGHATSLARLPLHQFWHAWVRSVAITKISSVAYSVPYQASVSLCSACWRIASAFCDSIFLWLGPSCIYSVCTRP